MESGSDRSLFSFLSSILSENLPRLSKRHFFVSTGTKVLFLLVYYQNLTDLLDRRFVISTIVDNQKMGHFRVLPGLCIKTCNQKAVKLKICNCDVNQEAGLTCTCTLLGGGGGDSMSSFCSLRQLETSLRAGSLHLLAAGGRQRGKRNGPTKSDFSRALPKIFPDISQVTENGIYMRS